MSLKNSMGKWREVLTSEQYRVTREAGTEAPFSGEYERHWDKGR
jgi:peptide-methionine (R)-S-oxide reductase